MSATVQNSDENRRKQFSVTNNLLLTFGVAICGYLANRVIETKVQLVGEMNYGFVFAFLSVMFGVLLTISRLLDFRYTAKRDRLNEKLSDGEKAGKNETQIKDEKKNKIRAECYAMIAHKLGKISWCLLTLQIGTLMLSITLLSIFVTNLKC